MRNGWLMAVAACALVPHGSHLPGWLIAVAALLFTWRLAQWKLGWPGASGLVKLLVVVACCAGNLWAMAQRGLRATKPRRCCQSRRSTL